MHWTTLNAGSKKYLTVKWKEIFSLLDTEIAFLETGDKDVAAPSLVGLQKHSETVIILKFQFSEILGGSLTC